MENLLNDIGRIDIYLFDQLMKRRITKEMRVFDAAAVELGR